MLGEMKPLLRESESQAVKLTNTFQASILPLITDSMDKCK